MRLMTSLTIDVVERDVAFYSSLARADQARFVEKVERFVRTKRVRGVDGVEVDDRVRVLVAAPACRLSLNLVAEDYRRLHNVDVHPTEILLAPTSRGRWVRVMKAELERPRQLREFSPELFGLPSAFYQQDPLRT